VFGTVRHMVFFVMELRSRAVHIAGIRIDPDGAWVMQVARNLLDPVDGFLRNATHLIHDRDPLFTAPSALLAGARTVYLREKLQQAGPFHSGSRRRGERCSSPEA
jgi:hypothetical protein